ncbi:MAG: DUF86 domain-containing protein [Verrucomicrobia subdivision 3 bacterium]|nr:DUF86 domain-containing protein [Limisphaerales bacterium]
MRAEEKKLLLDVLEACQSIQQHCATRTFEQYIAERWFRRAVEREFEIIGEALHRLERFAPVTAARITSLRRIIDFRNRIIHGYDSVDDVIVWQTAQQHLPLLLSEVKGMLQEESE